MPHTEEISSVYSQDHANDTTATLPQDKSFASKTDVNDHGPSASPTPPGTPPSHNGISVRIGIGLRTIGIVVPFAAIVAVFTWLVLSRRLEGFYGYPDDGGSFVIDRQSSVLLLLPALSSILALLTIGPLTSLSSYIHARLLLNKSQLLSNDKLPTPYEFGLLISHFGGGLGSLWRTFVYSHRPCKRTRFMHQLMGAVLLSGLGVLLSILVVASSIWLHASTKMVQIQENLPSNASARVWGRTLSEDCPFGPSASAGQPSVQLRFDTGGCRGRFDLLSGGDEAYLTAQNQSSQNRVVILTGTPMALLVDTRASSTSPFSSSSYAVSSYCEPIGRNCQLGPNGLSYNCPIPAFSGVVTKAVTLHYWNSSTSNSEDVDWTVAIYLKGLDNAFDSFANSGDAVLTGRNSRVLTVFRCSSLVHEVNYSYVGGQAWLQNSMLANSTVSSLILSGMFAEVIEGYAGFGNDLLEAGITTVAASTKMVEDLGGAFALIFSQTAMASAASIMDPIPIEGDLVNKLVTVMSKPAYCLLCFTDIALAVWALILGIIAIIICCTKAGVADVQARLSVLGVTARALGGSYQGRLVTNVKQLLYQDAASPQKNVRIVRTGEGGWSWIAA